MNILFFGSSNYCLPVLESLHEAFFLVGVISSSESSPNKYALSHNIKIYTPKNKTALLSLTNNISQKNPDLAIVIDYGLIIPPEIFNLPKYKTLNIHFSKLPQFRGPSPVQYTILTGQKNACISLILMDKGMDTGDIIWQKEYLLEGNETSESLYKKLFNMIALPLPNIINLYVRNELKPQKQDHVKASFTKLLSRQDGYIPLRILEMAMKGKKAEEKNIKDWPLTKILNTKYLIPNTASAIERMLRAFTPWPGIWTEVTMQSRLNRDNNVIMQQKKRLKILKAHLDPASKLILDQVQLEGKKPVTFKQFQEGHPNSSFVV